MKLAKRGVSLVACLLCLQVYGQDILLLDEVILETLNNNYSVKIVRNQVERSNINVTKGNAGMLPDVDLQANYSASTRDVEVETLNEEGRFIKIDRTFKDNNRGASVNVNYTLFDGLAMFYRYDNLKENADLSVLNQREASENIIIQTISNYMEALRFQQRYLVLRASLEASNDRYELVQKRKKAGSATNLEELNAQVDMINDSSALVQAELNFKNAIYELQYLMGRKNYVLSLAIDNSFSIDDNLDWSTVLNSAKTNNVFVLQAKKNVSISMLQYKLSDAARYPVLVASGSYGLNRSKSPLSIPRSSSGSALSGRVGLSFDLFNGGRKKIAQQTARIDWDNTLIQKEDVSQMVVKDLYIAYQNYETRLQVLDLLIANLANAEENFKNSNRSYEAGVINALALRQAQVNLLNTRNSINDAKIDAKLAEMNVKRLAGLLLE